MNRKTKSPAQRYKERLEKNPEPIEVIAKREAGRPLKYSTVEELEIAIAHYFNHCDSQEPKEPYTMSGLGYFLGMSRTAVLNYKERPEFVNAIKSARERVEYDVEKRLAGGTPATGLIFGLKNNFAWKDQTQLDITTKGERIFDLAQMKEAAKEILQEDDTQTES